MHNFIYLYGVIQMSCITLKFLSAPPVCSSLFNLYTPEPLRTSRTSRSRPMGRRRCPRGFGSTREGASRGCSLGSQPASCPTTALRTVKCSETLALCPSPPNCVVLVSLRLSLCKKRPCTPDELRVDKHTVTRREDGREGIWRAAVGGAWASPAPAQWAGSRWAA